MLARANEIRNTCPDPNRLRIDYFSEKAQVVPFPENSLLDPVDSSDEYETKSEIEKMILRTKEWFAEEVPRKARRNGLEARRNLPDWPVTWPSC